MKENYEHVLILKRAVKVISNYFRSRKLRRVALIKRMTKHSKKVIKMQALIRGHLERVRNAVAIKKVKTEGPKKTKKYKMISKL